MEETQGDKQIFEERTEGILKFIKKKRDWIFYLLLGILVYISAYLRTLNLNGLRDVSTGTWTLGPDLDPFLFLRWAKEILENGRLMEIDMMRYFPLGYNTLGEMKLLSYLIVWFHKLVSFFNNDATLTYSAVIFPVFMFCLAVIAFFLFTRKIFDKESKNFKNFVAIIATAFFAVMPSLLARTIAGIPEKESAAYFFVFIGLYFIICSYDSEKVRNSFIYAAVAGIATGLLALIWGGFGYVFMGISGAFLFAFLMDKIRSREIGIFSLWMGFSFLFMMPFSTRYALHNLIISVSTGMAFAVLGIFLIDLLLRKNKYFGLTKRTKIPRRILSLIIAVIIGLILSSIFFGPGFIVETSQKIISQTVHPLGSDRVSLTVAENKQPSFIGEWKNVFGPLFFNIPLFFWMFFIGAVALFYKLIKEMGRKEKFFLTLSYTVFLVCLIFSRYSPEGLLNGNSGFSILVYFGGAIFFLISFGYYYYHRFREGRGNVFKNFEFSSILYFVVLTITIMGARGGVRLIMVLAAFAPVAAAYLLVLFVNNYFKEKDEMKKIFFAVIAIALVLAGIFTFITYYEGVKNTAGSFVPGPYQWQWQKAMAWVRDNVQENAVFAHWWDYGYWVQSIGERATIVDGGNSITYWNHLMGRHVLTGKSDQEALEFLYAHNATHLLIDSTEIGKYTAYSSIGSDLDYDRFSWIMTFIMDSKQTYEKENETIYVYTGFSALDEDLVWENEEGNKIFLPGRAAGIIAMIVSVNGNTLNQPIGVYAYNNQQYQIPLRYAYSNNQLIDFQDGFEAGIFIYPRIDQAGGGQVSINPIGASFYLSNRTITGNFVRWYLFGEESENIKLVHKQPSYFQEILLQQGQSIGDFAYYNGFQGPIKIWEVDYPPKMKLNEVYLQVDYPDRNIMLAKEGLY